MNTLTRNNYTCVADMMHRDNNAEYEQLDRAEFDDAYARCQSDDERNRLCRLYERVYETVKGLML